ncbi:MAG: toll/interleukin-1 receptor domain-containing protein [gamma proteobacterium symbiont of Taylorina sp.]|nr:toll/interleukin-1 receptor domain-containing protein [gamma proteobacterium symbiont of Taylorina sp.]
MINREINNLILKCADIIAFEGKIHTNSVAYISLEKMIYRFLEKYAFDQTNCGEKIRSNLLKGTSTEHLTNEEVRLIIQALLEIKSSYNSQSNRIFISHSSGDAKIVEKFVGLMESIGLTNEHIFCSSVPGYGIPLGENIYDYLKKEFEDSNLFVIFILSDNYYKSVSCLNEMGATWINKYDYQSILLNDFKFNDIAGAIDPRNISFSVEDESRLNEFKDKIIDTFNLPSKNSSRWEQQRDEFIQNSKNITKL